MKGRLGRFMNSVVLKEINNAIFSKVLIECLDCIKGSLHQAIY